MKKQNILLLIPCVLCIAFCYAFYKVGFEIGEYEGREAESNSMLKYFSNDIKAAKKNYIRSNELLDECFIIRGIISYEQELLNHSEIPKAD